MRLLHQYLFSFLLIFTLNISTAFASPLPDKITTISAQFLGKPYLVDPLGEGPEGKYSQKPLYRFDGFDCQTYVETVLALALSEDNAQFKKTLLQIRYSNGKPNFLTRNHFPSADWISHNIQKQYIQYSALNQDKISIILNKQKWFEEKIHLNIPTLPSALKENLYYINLSHLSKILNNIPQGSIIMIVRPSSYVLISHMGFAIWKGNTLYFREASSLHHKVIDTPLWPYLQYQSHYGVKGIVVLIPTTAAQNPTTPSTAQETRAAPIK